MATKYEGISKRKRVRKDGTVYYDWRARYWDGTGQNEQIFAKLDDAKRWRRTELKALDDGKHINPRATRTLSAVADEWRETWTDLEPKTTQGYASILAAHVIPAFGERRITKVNAQHVQQWVNDLADDLAPNTVAHVHNVLRSVLDLATTRNYIAANPATSVKLPRKPTTNDSQLYLTPAELRQLVEAVPAHWRTPVLFSGLMGMRAGELWAIRRRDVDLAKQELTIAHAVKDIGGKLQAGPTKGHAQRKPSLVDFPELRTALENPGTRVRGIKTPNHPHPHTGYPIINSGELAWTDDPDDARRLLFTTPGGSVVLHTNFFERVFRPAVVKLWPVGHRLHGLRYHDLRHTAAALSLAADPSERGLFIVMKRLGHKDIRTTINIYGHLLPSVDFEHAAKLSAMWAATATPSPSNVFELHPSKGAA